MTSLSGGITFDYLTYVSLLSTSAVGAVKLGKYLEGLDKPHQKQATITTAAVVAPTISILALMGCQNYKLDKKEQALTTSAYIEQMSDEELEAALIKIGELEAEQDEKEEVNVL